MQTTRECGACHKACPLALFMNYNESRLIGNAGTTCRSCRESLPQTRICRHCKKKRRLDAFIVQEENAHYQDTLCQPCRNTIKRQWSRGSREIDGFINLPPKGSHSQVQCEECLTVMDRRQVNAHRCGGFAIAPANT